MAASCHVANRVTLPIAILWRNLAGMRAARVCVALVIAGGSWVPGVVRAENDKPEPQLQAKLQGRPREIVIETPGERSTKTKVVLASLAGAGVIAGALGVYFNLDARSASNDVSADRFIGEPWTPAHVELVDRADRASTRAIAFYSIGGALLVGATIAFIATDPKSERSVIRTTRATPTLAPAAGGAVVGGAWSF